MARGHVRVASSHERFLSYFLGLVEVIWRVLDVEIKLMVQLLSLFILVTDRN